MDFANFIHGQLKKSAWFVWIEIPDFPLMQTVSPATPPSQMETALVEAILPPAMRVSDVSKGTPSESEPYLNAFAAALGKKKNFLLLNLLLLAMI
jgi:hypothetical protein